MDKRKAVRNGTAQVWLFLSGRKRKSSERIVQPCPEHVELVLRAERDGGRTVRRHREVRGSEVVAPPIGSQLPMLVERELHPEAPCRSRPRAARCHRALSDASRPSVDEVAQ